MSTGNQRAISGVARLKLTERPGNGSGSGGLSAQGLEQLPCATTYKDSVGVSKSDGAVKSRVCSSNLFFITISLDVELYKSIREDIIESFSHVVSYLCAIESSSTSISVSNHAHVFLEFSVGVYLSELVEYCQCVFNGMKLDVQSVRRRADVLKYISKEDKFLYTNIKSSSLHFNYRAYQWAKGAPKFHFSDPFVMEHRFCYHFLQNLHREVRNSLIAPFYGFDKVNVGHLGWHLRVCEWWNGIIGSKGKKRKQLYLWGDSNVGKSTVVENLVGNRNASRIFYPGVGKFGFQDFDSSVHEVIVFEEYESQYYCNSMLKRLLEGRVFSAPVKCGSDKLIEFNGPVIFVSNFGPPADDQAFCNRVLEIVGDAPYYLSQTAPVPKTEGVEEEETNFSKETIEISSDEEEEASFQ